jgi:hypothetical protein
MTVLAILVALTTATSGCNPLSPSQAEAARNFLKSQANGGCYCVDNCLYTGCSDRPGATVTYQGQSYPVGCYCTCVSIVTGGCTWSDVQWDKETKVNGIEIDEK